MLFQHLKFDRVGPSKCLLVQSEEHDTTKKSKKKFLTAIWLPHNQLWAILKDTASLTRCLSLRFGYFEPKVTGNLITR